MNGPHPGLSELYNTLGNAAQTQTDEAFEKEAQARLFVKLAERNGIDLEAMSDEQVQDLWQQTVGTKLASDDGDEDDKGGDKKPPPFAKKEDGDKDEDEKKAEAAAEFEAQKQAQEQWSQKQAEADYLGRVMAHSMHDELNKIAAARESEEEIKEAKGFNAVQAAKNLGQFAAHGARQGAQAAKSKGKELAGAAKNMAGKGKELAKKHGPAAGVGAAAGGAAGFAAGRASKKQASALDELAAEHALKLASDRGYDAEQTAQRLGAVLVLGLGDSEKVASAGNFDQALEVRALEMLEAAGFPVSWETPAE